MSFPENLAIVLALCALLSLISYKFGLLTPSGSAASFVMGVVIGVFGSINWLVMLITFALAGFVVTRYKIDVKMKNGLQEGRKGERTYKNVFANAFVPAMIAIISYAVGMQNQPIAALAYLCSISVAAADTIASELGVLSPNVRLITNLKKVPPGTDGGISAYGTLWAILAAIFVSLAGWVVLFPGTAIDDRVFVPIVMGVFGCMVDSLIGATFETWKLVDKLGNNVSSMAIGAIVGVAILLSF
jgi:uncharacterized protein (TIGR00297 family)